MDGTRDRPPGKTAQNWSRTDGIRAGAVTGPWRSAPREPEAARPAAQAARHTAAGAPAGWRPGLRGWIAVGALGALAIVALAVLFRPAGSGAPVAGSAPPAVPMSETVHPRVAAAAPTGGPAGGPAEAPRPLADPALAGVSVVRLRVGPDVQPERQAAIVAAIRAAGLTAIVVEPLPFEIATSRVGYYRADDLAAAEALGRVVAPVIAPGGSVGVRDYGQLLADAQPGRLDLWVGS